MIYSDKLCRDVAECCTNVCGWVDEGTDCVVKHFELPGLVDKKGAIKSPFTV